MKGNSSYPQLGFKVFDRRRDEVEPLLLQAIDEKRPLEIGLYFHDPATHDLLNTLLPESDCRLNTHFDHRRLSVFALDDPDLVPLLRRQFEHSLQWGASYAINHLSAFSLGRRGEYQSALEQRLIQPLRLLNRLSREYRLPVHIENTYHELDLYRRIFHAIEREGLDQLHFCFDFGHAKIWSGSPLVEWLDFLNKLQALGHRLHYHLHTNRGLSDEHLSFLEAEWMDCCEADGYTAPWNSFEALAAIEERFPEARKVMEVPPAEAGENLRRVIEEIDRIRERRLPISA